MLEQKTTTKRRRRISVEQDSGASGREVSEVSLETAKALTDSIERDQEKIARLQEKIKEQLADLHSLLIDLDLQEVHGKVGVAKRYIPVSRASSTIDPAAYYQKVDLEDFLDSVKVLSTKAKDHLSGKELAAITTKRTPDPKPEQIKVVPISEG